MDDLLSDDFQEALDDLLSDVLPQPASIVSTSPQKTAAVSRLSIPKKSGRKVDRTAGARARRYRERRKEQLNEELRENKRLKSECLELSETIEGLENEIQTAQGGYMFRHLDLKAENDAVRNELKGYQAFVAEIVQLALRPLPSSLQATSSSVQYQRSTLKSLQIKEFICQTVGLAQSSLNGDTWQSKPSVKLRNGMQANVRYQYLPTGCTGKAAKRLNLRVDVPGLCCNIDQLFEVVKHRSFDEAYRQKMCRISHESRGVKVTQVQAAQTDAGNKIAFKQLRLTSDGVDAQQLVGCSNETIPVDARAFDLVSVERGTVDAKIIVSAGGGELLETCGDACHETEHKISFANSCFGGVLFRRNGEDRCDLSFIRSLPFNSPCLGGARNAERIIHQLEAFGTATASADVLDVVEPFVPVLMDLNRVLSTDA